jgi:hypothetical protein
MNAGIMSAQSDNVLFVQSGNVLLTRSGWRGGIRNASHDPTGPRSVDRIEKSHDGADHAAAGRRGDWANRTAYPAAGKAKKGGRSGGRARSRGKRSNRKLAEKSQAKAIAILKQQKYRGFGPTLGSEYLGKHHQIRVSRETLRAWMIEGRLWRPREQRMERVHVWRPRRWRCGELVQWDTSEHAWLEKRGPKFYLISMIDDATSRIHARFVFHDSTEENMRLLWSYLEAYGRPLSFYTDKASLFRTFELLSMMVVMRRSYSCRASATHRFSGASRGRSLRNAEIVLSMHLDATFQIPNVTHALAAPDYALAYLQPSAVAIVEYIETRLLKLGAGARVTEPV